jgi:Cys-rich repeat protein
METPPCEGEEFYECLFVPPMCDSDADCEAGFVCETYDSFDCDDVVSPACPEGAECPVPEESDEDCVEESESYCVPPYFADCAADADCGPGFACVAEESCSCSGSSGGGTDSDGGSSEPVPVPDEPGTPQDKDGEDCGCEPTGSMYCELIPVECTSDADCAEGASCLANPDSDGTCTSTPGGDTVCDEPMESVSYCIPDGYLEYMDSFGGGRGSDDVANESGLDGEGAPTADPNNDSGSNSASTDGDEDGGGCSAAAGGSGSSGWVIALALAGLLRRKRRATETTSA